MKIRALSITMLAAIPLMITSLPAAADTVDDIRDRGYIQCGVSQGLPGFSQPDDVGNWEGLDVEFCRAVAAAILGDASKFRITPLSAKERFTALQSGEIDLLVRNTTWTMGRDTQLGDFPGVVNYFDGQGFLVRKSLGIDTALDLDGASACTNTGTTTELNLEDYFRNNDLTYELVAFEKADEVVAAYDEGRCDVYTTDRSSIAAQRLKMSDPDEHKLLPEIISKEPLGPMVRSGDHLLGKIVRWTHYAMLNAEELGVTSANVSKMSKTAKDPKVRRLLGLEGSYGPAIGLNNDWIVQILSQVGNYGEVFDATVGPDTPLGLARGANALWTEGGLQYAPPIR